MADVQAVARQVLSENMGAVADESLVVVTDTDKQEIGRALFEAGVDLELESGIVQTPPMERSGMEPPAFVSAAMQEADIVVAPTSASLTHTRAREAATEAGARVATMPGIT